jgi:hypothetical protein
MLRNSKACGIFVERYEADTPTGIAYDLMRRWLKDLTQNLKKRTLSVKRI